MNVRRAMGRLLPAMMMISLACAESTGPGAQHKEEGAHAHAPTLAPPALPTQGSTGQPELRSAAQLLTAVPRVEGARLRARILVLSADGTEPVLAAIRQALDYLGTPYDVHVATESPGALTAAKLSSGTLAHYQAVFLTTAALARWDGAGWSSALSDEEWNALRYFEAAFAVREVVWYAWPHEAIGYGAASEFDTSARPLHVRLTEAGKSHFPYLNASQPLEIRNAWTYRATALEGTTPLLVDDEGHTLALVQSVGGRESLSLTFDGTWFLNHSVALSYGLVSWATRGLFVGQRRVFLGAQIDDLFLSTDLYPSGQYRMSGQDLAASHQWQLGARARMRSPQLTLDYAFNGWGAVSGEYPNDTLTPMAKELRGKFKWLNHTLSHLELTNATYAETAEEFEKNHKVAAQLGLRGYRKENAVTPRISGLRNPEAMAAAYDQGVRFIVSDTSHPDQNAEVANGGLANYVEPRILMIPRRPTNLFYNVSTPPEWVAEYNMLYESYWGRALSYEEILDKESDLLLMYLLRGEVYPWMFHQANVRFYEPGRSLLTDLLDTTFDKYERFYTLPILSPPQEGLAARVRRRIELAAADVQVVIEPGVKLTVSSDRQVVVPISGLASTGKESYGGAWTSWLPVKPGGTVSVSLNETTVPVASP